MTGEIEERLRKARRLFRVARTYDADEDPEGVAHHAYYAMYHAAAAVLLSRDGSHPKTHATLVGQSGLAVKDKGDPARHQGRALREAYELRILADYDAGAANLGDRARASLGAVASFIAFAERLIAEVTPTRPTDRRRST